MAGAGPGADVKVDLSAVPPGVDIVGQKATDAISATLAAISPGQMQDVMAGMKVGPVKRRHSLVRR